MQYVDIEDCYNRLFELAIKFDSSQKTPNYQSNEEGMDKLKGVLSRVKESWYEGYLEKAAYLFVSINKGHFFINGNKRISLLITLDFLYKNNYQRHRPLNKRAYLSWFKKEFPKYKIENRRFKKIYGWALYNLSKAVAADNNLNFDQLKLKVENFIKLSFKSV